MTPSLGMSLAKNSGRPSGVKSRHRAHGDTEAVGEPQPGIDPPLRVVLQLLLRDLPGGQHDLAVLAVHGVPVDVGVLEVVVGPDLLDLTVHVQERAVVPQPDVVHGLQVVGYQPLRQRGCNRVGAHGHSGQVVAPAGEVDVSGDVLALLDELVRVHRQPLHRPGPEELQHHQQHEPERDPSDREPEAAHVGVDQHQHGDRRGDHRQDEQRGAAGVDVGVGGAEYRALVRQHEVPAVEPVAGRQEQEDDRNDDRHVDLEAGRELEADAPEAEPHEVQNTRRYQYHYRGVEQPAADEVIQGQAEDVERHVPVEDGIGIAEGDRVPEPEEQLPLGRREDAEHHAEEGAAGYRAPEDQPPQEVRRRLRQRRLLRARGQPVR